MANLKQYLGGNAFKPSEVPESDYELLPDGDYIAMVTASEIKATKAGNALVLSVEIIEGKGKGRKFQDYLNIDHPNEKAVEIAYQTLAALARAVGKDSVEDSAELHDKRILIKVGTQKGEGTYTDKDGNEKPRGDQNRIKTYKKYEGVQPSSGQESASGVSSGGAKKPWQK